LKAATEHTSYHHCPDCSRELWCVHRKNSYAR